MRCLARVAHNALKWAVWEVYPSPDHLDELWALFAGVRNSSDKIHGHLGQWLALNLDFHDRADLPDPAEALSLWAGYRPGFFILF